MLVVPSVVPVAGRVLVATLALAVVAPTFAQQSPTPGRIRGTIENVDGDTLSVKSRSGELFRIRVSDKVAVVDIVKISLADIKQGLFIGTAAVPQPDGSQKALEVHVFPEAMRGTGEGF